MGARRAARSGGTVTAVTVPLVVLVVAACVALAGWATWFVVADRAVVLRQLGAAAGVVALLLVQAVVAGLLLARGDGSVSGGLFWGYVVTQALVLPLAGLWAFAERTRWNSVVLAVAALTVAFLEYRLVQIWGGR